MIKTLYKVLDKDMHSPFQCDFTYEIGREYRCNDFDIDPTIDCSMGFYAVDIDGLPYVFRPGRQVYLCAVWGKSVEYDQYKRRYSRIKILERIPNSKIKALAKVEENRLGYKLSEILFPHNPLTKKRTPTEKDIELIRQWASVWDSVGASVWDSVGASVGDSVGAYISGLFPNIQKWKYIEHTEGINPFQPAIDLWYCNLVSSYDGDVWRLHSGKNAEIVWEQKDD